MCLHGGPGSTHNYFRPLERLADERPVVLYDQLGCGRSDRPDVEWSLAVFTEELEQLREHLGLDAIHLLGTSWGGMLALEHALAQPASVRSLVLSSTLASADEWVVEVKRLRDAIEGDDDEVIAGVRAPPLLPRRERAARARRGCARRGTAPSTRRCGVGTSGR